MISFIIPTLNEEKVLAKTLECLTKYKGEKEIIVSDGGSTDRTAEISRNFTEHVLIYTGQARQTIAGGRNAGAAFARGEYLVFLDADMFIPQPDVFFGRALQLFRNDSQLVALTGALRVYKNMETFADRCMFGLLNFFHYLQNNLLGIAAAPGEFQMVRSDIFRQIHGYNEELVAGEDYEFFKRMGKKGRTHFEKQLLLFHTGRRAHKVGWPRLVSTWILNSLSVQFFKKAVSKEWLQIR